MFFVGGLPEKSKNVGFSRKFVWLVKKLGEGQRMAAVMMYMLRNMFCNKKKEKCTVAFDVLMIYVTMFLVGRLRKNEKMLVLVGNLCDF
jgi:hypothetical protein